MTCAVVLEDGYRKVRSPDYNYDFNLANGYFARWGATKEEDPCYSAYGPEIADIEISVGDCSGKCPWCYKSNRVGNGQHMTLKTFKAILDKMPDTLTQVALGLTDLDANKDLIPIMLECRKRLIVPNFTMSGLGYSDAVLERAASLCGAVSVSVYEHNREEAYDTIKKLSDLGVEQTNIHLVYHSKNVAHVLYVMLDTILDKRLSGVNAVTLLALKQKGRAINGYKPIDTKSFEKLVGWATKNGIRLGFDSCSAHRCMDALKKIYTDEQYKEVLQMIEPCESGLFSIYIDVLARVFPCSFSEGEIEPINVLEANDFVQDVWNHPTMTAWRKRLLDNNRACPIYEI